MLKMIRHLAHSIIRQNSTQGDIQVVIGHLEIPCVRHISDFSFYAKKVENQQASDQETFSFQSSYPVCSSISAPHFSRPGSNFSRWGNGVTVNVGSKEPGNGFPPSWFHKVQYVWMQMTSEERTEPWRVLAAYEG